MNIKEKTLKEAQKEVKTEKKTESSNFKELILRIPIILSFFSIQG